MTYYTGRDKAGNYVSTSDKSKIDVSAGYVERVGDLPSKSSSMSSASSSSSSIVQSQYPDYVLGESENQWINKYRQQSGDYKTTSAVLSDYYGHRVDAYYANLALKEGRNPNIIPTPPPSNVVSPNIIRSTRDQAIYEGRNPDELMPYGSGVLRQGLIAVPDLTNNGKTHIIIPETNIPKYNKAVDMYNAYHKSIASDKLASEDWAPNSLPFIYNNPKQPELVTAAKLEQKPTITSPTKKELIYSGVIAPTIEKYDTSKLDSKTFSSNQFGLTQKSLTKAQKSILNDALVSEKLGTTTDFLSETTELFNPMEDFKKFDLGKGNVLPGIIGLGKIPSYVVGVAATTVGGGIKLVSSGTEYVTQAGVKYYDYGKKGLNLINAYKKTLKLPTIIREKTIKIVPSTATIVAGAVGFEVATGFPVTKNIIGSTIDEATSNPIKFGTEMALFEGIGKIGKAITNVGALESKAVIFLEKGRGVKYLVNGGPSEKLVFKEVGLLNTIKYDLFKVKPPNVEIAPEGAGFVQGAVTKNFPTIDYFKSGKSIKVEQQISLEQEKELDKFISASGKKVFTQRVEPFNLLKPNTYIDKLLGNKPGQFKNMYYAKRSDLFLKDYPSELSGVEIKSLGGKQVLGATVSPGKGTPFAGTGLKKFLKLSEPKYEVKAMPGTSILRQFGGGIEKGQFFAPETKKTSILQYIKGELKSYYTPEKEVNLLKLGKRAKTNVVSSIKNVIPVKERGLIETMAKNNKKLVLTGSTAEQIFTTTKLDAKDIDFISTQAKKQARNFINAGKKQGLNISLGEAKHAGTYNILINKIPRIQITQVGKFPEIKLVEGIQVYTPKSAISSKFAALTNPLYVFRHEKDLSRLQALVKGNISKRRLLKKVEGKASYPQAYVYYAGVGREPELLDVATGQAKIGWGRSPKIMFERQKIQRISKGLLQPATRKEISLIKQEFAERFVLAKKVELGLVPKPSEFLSANDLAKLLKRGSYADYAVYRRLTGAFDIPGRTQVGVGALSGLRTELETIKAVRSVSKKVQLGSGIRSNLSRVFDIGEVQLKYAPTKDVFGAVFQKFENVPLNRGLAKKGGTFLNKANNINDNWLFKASKNLSKVSDGTKPIYSVSKRLSRVAVFFSASLMGANKKMYKVSYGASKINLGSGKVPTSLSKSFSGVNSRSTFGKVSSVPSVSSNVSGRTSIVSPSINSSSASIGLSVSMPKTSSSLSGGRNVSSGLSSAKISLGSSSVSGRSVFGSPFSSRVRGGFSSGASSGGSFNSFSSGFSSGGGSSGGNSSGGGSSGGSLSGGGSSINSITSSFKSKVLRINSKSPSFRQSDYSLLKRGYTSFREPNLKQPKYGTGRKKINLLLQKTEQSKMPKQSYFGKQSYSDKLVFNDVKGMRNEVRQDKVVSINDFSIKNLFKKSKSYTSSFRNAKLSFKGMAKEKNRYVYNENYSYRLPGYSYKTRYHDTDLFNKREIM